MKRRPLSCAIHPRLPGGGHHGRQRRQPGRSAVLRGRAGPRRHLRASRRGPHARLSVTAAETALHHRARQRARPPRGGRAPRLLPDDDVHQRADAEVLVLVEVDDAGCGHRLCPAAGAADPRMGYALVGIDRDTARQKFAQVACVSFSRGTHITMASGAQKPVEELAVGDTVLTRDDGPQPVRWIGQSTLRAVGEFAPIRIRPGTLHNERDLLVSPDHRLFIYQRFDALGAGRHEVLVRARHLVNGDTVVRQSGRVRRLLPASFRPPPHHLRRGDRRGDLPGRHAHPRRPAERAEENPCRHPAGPRLSPPSRLRGAVFQSGYGELSGRAGGRPGVSASRWRGDWGEKFSA